MKPGITTKLFLAVFGASASVVLAMSVASQYSFSRGFLGYLNQQGAARMETVLPGLVAAYEQHGDWEFLRENPRAWFDLIRPAPDAMRLPEERGYPPLPESDLTGIILRVSLLDRQRRFVIGNPGEVGPDAVLREIEVGGNVVGWLAILPFQQVSTNAELRFQQQQQRSFWMIGGLSALLAALVALGLTRVLLVPIKRIAGATHRLAAGDYGSRVQVSTRDEIGRLAEDFNHLAQTLEKNERMRRDFMADVSHELRTPLAVLRGELEAIEDGVRRLTPESLKSLQAEVGTLSKLVSDLYDLSLADVGALAYRKVDVDVVDLLATTLAPFRQRYAERGLMLEALLPTTQLGVCADEARLHQLFANLLENSLRYTDAGGLLRVSCSRQGGRVAIVFEDSAPGVPLALLPRLFERFYRVEGSRNRASGGAGLGLAICRNIVEAHGGIISAGPSPLGGLRISIEFPLATDWAGSWTRTKVPAAS